MPGGGLWRQLCAAAGTDNAASMNLGAAPPARGLKPTRPHPPRPLATTSPRPRLQAGPWPAGSGAPTPTQWRQATPPGLQFSTGRPAQALGSWPMAAWCRVARYHRPRITVHRTIPLPMRPYNRSRVADRGSQLAGPGAMGPSHRPQRCGSCSDPPCVSGSLTSPADTLSMSVSSSAGSVAMARPPAALEPRLLPRAWLACEGVRVRGRLWMLANVVAISRRMAAA